MTAPGIREGQPSPSIRLLLDTATSPTLLTGLYAWGLSLTPTVVMGGRSSLLGEHGPIPVWSVVLALLALPVLAAGAGLRNVSFEIARAFGVWGFLGLCTASFLTGPAAIELSDGNIEG